MLRKFIRFPIKSDHLNSLKLFEQKQRSTSSNFIASVDRLTRPRNEIIKTFLCASDYRGYRKRITGKKWMSFGFGERSFGWVNLKFHGSLGGEAAVCMRKRIWGGFGGYLVHSIENESPASVPKGSIGKWFEEVIAPQSNRSLERRLISCQTIFKKKNALLNERKMQEILSREKCQMHEIVGIVLRVGSSRSKSKHTWKCWRIVSHWLWFHWG